MKSVAKPNNSPTTISPSHTAIASRLRSTALIEVTAAVTASTRRCTIIGKEKALTANVSAANMAPMTLPMPEIGDQVAQSRLAARRQKDTQHGPGPSPDQEDHQQHEREDQLIADVEPDSGS